MDSYPQTSSKALFSKMGIEAMATLALAYQTTPGRLLDFLEEIETRDTVDQIDILARDAHSYGCVSVHYITQCESGFSTMLFKVYAMQLIRYGLISEDRGRFVNVLGRYLEILDFISKQQLSLIDGMVLIAGRTKLLATAVLLKKNASATISKLVQTAFTPVSFQQPQTMHEVMEHEFFQQLYAQKEGFYDRIPERGIRFMFGKGSLKKNGQNALSPPLGTLEKYVLASGLHRFLWDYNESIKALLIDLDEVNAYENALRSGSRFVGQRGASWLDLPIRNFFYNPLGGLLQEVGAPNFLKYVDKWYEAKKIHAQGLVLLKEA